MYQLTRFPNCEGFLLSLGRSFGLEGTVWRDEAAGAISKIFRCSRRYSDALEDFPKISQRYSDALEDIPIQTQMLSHDHLQDKSQKRYGSLHLTHLSFLLHSDQCPLMRSSTLTQRDRATSHSMFSLAILPGQLFSY